MAPLSHALVAHIVLLAGLLITMAQNNCELCLKNSSFNTSCHESCKTASFEDIVNMSANNSIQELGIFICSSVVDLWKVVTFENKKHVSFVAAKQGATISCLNESAGIVFMNVSTVSISGVHFVGCSVRQNGSVSFAASIVISHCNSVTVSDFEVRNSTGVGLALINICKSVEVTQSSFTSCENGGLYVDYPEHQDRNCSTTIHISASNFSNNGGGLKAFFQDLNHPISMVIVECVFEKNEANSIIDVMDSFSGGAVYLNFNNNSLSEVSVHINNSRFCKNSAKLNGGAVAVSYHGHQHYKTEIVISGCQLLSNRASNGGGVSLELVQEISQQLSVTFVSCEWRGNLGEHGAAINVVSSHEGDLTCGCFSGPVFENCTFKENKAEESEIHHDPNNVIHRFHKGILFSRDIDIQLQGRMHFEGNRGSAMYLLSSNVYFNKNSHVNFIENHAYRGGAIAMYGTSVLNVYSNVSIIFKWNKAYYLGGAIFQNKIHDQTCFLQYRGSNSTEGRNVKITFLNNTSSADNNEHSIFLSTFCYCLKENQTILDFLNLTATFNFICSDELREISTLGQNCDSSSGKYIIPGQVTDIGIDVIDDTNDVVPPLFKISVTPSNNSENISVDDAYVYTSNYKVKLKGKPNSSGELKVYNLYLMEDSFLSLNFTLQECPPGFVYSEEESVCTCSVQISSHTYLGITNCDMSTFQASLIHTFWAGYIDVNNESGYGTQADFRTNNCPKGYCTPPKKQTVEVTLPNTTNCTEISSKVCNENRTGIMCGNCVDGNSVFYHTYDYNCFYDSELCTVGWLFYVLSELVPVTIFFALVLCFDISFTSGFVSAFVFYAQMFDTLHVSANNFIFFEKPIHVLLNCLRFIVRMFNLTFFSVEQLSFCLWKGANALDMIAFNYVTIIYSFILVIITVALANRCSIKMNLIFGVDKSHLSNSIIHGLSSFLVLCYFQTTKVSLFLLTPTYLEGVPLRVFYHPGFHYFRREHLHYAIPAVFFLIFIAFLPPLLLLCYPLCYKVLALCKLEESKFTKVLCKVIPLEKYKPFFDSFQGTFKDEHRYFSGLFFMYRLTTLLTYAVTHSLLSFYILTELQFILMLLLHALICPHKNRRNNSLDMSIFALLAVLNGLTLFNYLRRTSTVNDGVIVSVTNLIQVSVISSIQVLLAWVPVVCMLIYIGIKITTWIRIRVKSKLRVSPTARDIPELSLSLLDDVSTRHLSAPAK